MMVNKNIRKSSGLTLIELLVALSIVAILTAVALPTFQYVIQSVQVSSAVNSFLSDIRFARSEASRRGGSVVLCRSDDPQAAAPVCSDASAAAGWASGWIVFQDLGLTSAGGGKDPEDPLLRLHQPLTALGTISSGQAAVSKFRFAATGRLLNDSLGLDSALTFGSADYAATVQRVVCVGLGGRARVAGDGTKSC